MRNAKFEMRNSKSAAQMRETRKMDLAAIFSFRDGRDSGPKMRMFKADESWACVLSRPRIWRCFVFDESS